MQGVLKESTLKVLICAKILPRKKLTPESHNTEFHDALRNFRLGVQLSSGVSCVHQARHSESRRGMVVEVCNPNTGEMEMLRLDHEFQASPEYEARTCLKLKKEEETMRHPQS